MAWATAGGAGGGTFTSGPWPTTIFSFTDLAVTSTDGYPAGGTLTFTGGGFTIVVHYDGDDSALITVGGVGVYEVNLDNGQITESTTT